LPSPYADLVIKVLKESCDLANRSTTKKGLGFSTTRACSTAEPGCVCHITRPAMPGGASQSDTYDYFYLNNAVTDPKDFVSVSHYMQQFTKECEDMKGTLSCFGGATNDAGPPGIGDGGEPIGYGTYLECSSTDRDATSYCRERTFPTTPLSDVEPCLFTNGGEKITYSTTQHCPEPAVPGWSCAFADGTDRSEKQYSSSPRWAEPANRRLLEFWFKTDSDLCKADHGTFTVYHLALNPDGSLASPGTEDAGATQPDAAVQADSGAVQADGGDVAQPDAGAAQDVPSGTD
jgi:hypothetical protein